MMTVESDTARSGVTRRRARGAAGGSSAVTSWLTPLIVLAGFVPLLIVVPRLVSLAPDVASAAAVEGYNTSVAYLVAAGWIVACTLAIAFLAHRSGTPRLPDAPGPGLEAGTARAVNGPSKSASLLPPVLLLVGVAAIVFLVYFPPFLARSGPFIEDQIHLGALHRMIGGMQPYRDFEFLYGPLMLYIPWGWTRLFGFSLPAFYTFVALLEVVSFVILTVVVWLMVRDRNRRWLVLVLLAAMAFNALLGPNWSVSRRLPALLALVSLAWNPTTMRNVLVAAALLAVQAGWSHDIGAAGMIGALAILGLAARHVSARDALRSALTLVVVTAALWAGLVWSLLGNAFGDYLDEVRYLTSRFSAGEAGFEFYWTVNSLAVFLLIAVVCVIVGRRLLAGRAASPSPADYLLIGACGFLLVTLKSGLNRSDLWHLNAPLIPLMLAALATGSRRMFAATRFEHRTIVAASAVIAFTYAFGLLPSASFLAQGWWRGLTGVSLAQTRDIAVPQTAAPVLALERRPPDSSARRLAAFFSDPQRFGRPVVFYADTWPLPKFIGVFKADFINDDFLYGDERGDRVRSFLESNPDALVVMSEEVHDRLFGLADTASFPEHERRFRPTPAKRIARWLSTVHYDGLDEEIAVKDARWRRTVGMYVRDRFRVTARIDSFIVLEQDGA